VEKDLNQEYIRALEELAVAVRAETPLSAEIGQALDEVNNTPKYGDVVPHLEKKKLTRMLGVTVERRDVLSLRAYDQTLYVLTAIVGGDRNWWVRVEHHAILIDEGETLVSTHPSKGFVLHKEDGVASVAHPAREDERVRLDRYARKVMSHWISYGTRVVNSTAVNQCLLRVCRARDLCPNQILGLWASSIIDADNDVFTGCLYFLRNTERLFEPTDMVALLNSLLFADPHGYVEQDNDRIIIRYWEPLFQHIQQYFPEELLDHRLEYEMIEPSIRAWELAYPGRDQ
jgi:hypothetical protein